MNARVWSVIDQFLDAIEDSIETTPNYGYSIQNPQSASVAWIDYVATVNIIDIYNEQEISENISRVVTNLIHRNTVSTCPTTLIHDLNISFGTTESLAGPYIFHFTCKKNN